MGSKPFKESNFNDLAGNMVSTPVLLAMVMSAIAAASWVPAPKSPNEQQDDSAPGHEQHDDDGDGDMEEDIDGEKMTESEIAECAFASDGLLHGGPIAANGESKGMKRRGGLLQQVFSKVPKTRYPSALGHVRGPPMTM